MTKSWHYCDHCNGKNGVFVKICTKTGKPIEDYKMQLERQTKELYTKEK